MASEHETLKDHIQTCMRILEEEVLCKGLTRIWTKRHNLSEDEVNNLLKIAVFSHDIAKGYKEYQERFRRGKGFSKHEFYSAYITGVTFGGTKNIELAQVTILWHHMADRGPNFAESWNERSLYKYGTPRQITVDNKFRSLIPRLARNYGLSFSQDLPEKVTEEDVAELVKPASKLCEYVSKYYIPISLMLRYLIIADSTSAFLNRGGNLRQFLRDYIFSYNGDLHNLREEIKRGLGLNF